MEPTNDSVNAENEQSQMVQCMKCGRQFRTNRGMLQHLRHCNSDAPNDEVDRPPPPPPPPPHQPDAPNNNNNAPKEEQFHWGNALGTEAVADLKSCYEEIVFWRKNLFMLPKGSSGKDYIKELTRLINEWVAESPVRECAMYAIHVMPALLLQKPSKTSKSRDHVKVLDRRIVQWRNGDFQQLLREAKALQNRLPKHGTKANINLISRKFREQMGKGNVNAAIKLLSNNMEGGVMPLNEETKEMLKIKHPVGEEAKEDVLLQGPLPTVENVIFETIDEAMVYAAAKMTRGGSGPSGIDADGWRRILISRDYGETGNDLRKSLRL